MRYTVRKSIIDVIGTVWMPAVEAAMTYTLDDYDVDNARDVDGYITRESVENWLDSHAGDFQRVIDFSASIEDGPDTIDIPWAEEINEINFMDNMYPEDEYA